LKDTYLCFFPGAYQLRMQGYFQLGRFNLEPMCDPRGYLPESRSNLPPSYQRFSDKLTKPITKIGEAWKYFSKK